MRKFKFALLGILIMTGLAYAIYSGFSKSMVYYYTVSEIAEDPPSKETNVKVSGKVLKGSVLKDMNVVQFKIYEGENVINVIYKGILPDAFTEEGEVIAEGKYIPSKKTIVAHTLMTKCPSRYETAEE